MSDSSLRWGGHKDGAATRRMILKRRRRRFRCRLATSGSRRPCRRVGSTSSTRFLISVLYSSHNLVAELVAWDRQTDRQIAAVLDALPPYRRRGEGAKEPAQSGGDTAVNVLILSLTHSLMVTRYDRGLSGVVRATHTAHSFFTNYRHETD